MSRLTDMWEHYTWDTKGAVVRAYRAMRSNVVSEYELLFNIKEFEIRGKEHTVLFEMISPHNHKSFCVERDAWGKLFNGYHNGQLIVVWLFHERGIYSDAYEGQPE